MSRACDYTKKFGRKIYICIDREKRLMYTCRTKGLAALKLRIDIKTSRTLRKFSQSVLKETTVIELLNQSINS